MTLLIVEIGIRIAIINIKIIIIKVIATAIDVGAIAVVITKIIKIRGIITLKDEKIRISIRIKDLKRILARIKPKLFLILNLTSRYIIRP